jgi:hypothetical protein
VRVCVHVFSISIPLAMAMSKWGPRCFHIAEMEQMLSVGPSNIEKLTK